VRKRTQLRTKAMGETTWTKRNKRTGKFVSEEGTGEEEVQGCPPREKGGVTRRETT
jgi:hypothetical protein